MKSLLFIFADSCNLQSKDHKDVSEQIPEFREIKETGNILQSKVLFNILCIVLYMSPCILEILKSCLHI